MNTLDINQFMPWVVALIIGVLSAIVNFIISARQRKITLQEIRMEVLSKNRQEWINTLRNSLSEFLSSHEMAKLIFRHDKPENEFNLEYTRQFTNWLRLYHQIQLLLNPKEEKPQKLITAMYKLNLTASNYNDTSKDSEYEACKNEIIEISQAILKEEWERVKKIE